MSFEAQRPGYERRKLPDPTTPRLLVLWGTFLTLFVWLGHSFFKKDLYAYDGQDWSLTPFGIVLIYLGSIGLAVLVSGIYYKFKFGKFHFYSILRVVRGLLSLFNIAVLAVWPISMIIIALNPLQAIYLLFLGLVALVVLSCVIRLAGPSEMGFWRDWVNDTLLRW